MKYTLNWDELIDENNVDSISGRDLGTGYAKNKDILKKIEDGDEINIVISQKIKAINDSFIKGFFAKIFEEYKTVDKIKDKFSVDAYDAHFTNLIQKNWRILENSVK